MNDLTRDNGPTISSEDWRQELPFWLQYLVAAYPRAKNDAMTFAVFEDQFADVAEEVMSRVARRWVESNTFWPAVHELRAYVKWAEGETEQKPEDPEAMYRFRMARLRAQIRYTDEEILRWEQARGTMPSDEDLAEIEAMPHPAGDKVPA